MKKKTIRKVTAKKTNANPVRKARVKKIAAIVRENQAGLQYNPPTLPETLQRVALLLEKIEPLAVRSLTLTGDAVRNAVENSVMRSLLGCSLNDDERHGVQAKIIANLTKTLLCEENNLETKIAA